MKNYSNTISTGKELKKLFIVQLPNNEIPRLGDPTVAFINRALQYAKHQAYCQVRQIELLRFEQDVKIINQYIKCQVNNDSQNDLYENILKRNNKIYKRAYLKAIQIYKLVSYESII